ncbi:TetR/AcrR family transcriptional regulator [Neobacillus massiliamazoniensis]|uniref:TetR family transcriptional regulator n=1 Tax=Neobacillus massiliamazoniensis TaxID=1499688 RepID=A0A0U1NXZ0_9BACI|nr:TetR/AcrR family transcriptional regulator [Neobacillus massiliamazoniensis]CRK82874.1 TetR family transcriptional regulator [Neobacillus massiliamazoniensis]
MAGHEDRKQQIIDKAVGLFAELGYYKTTTAMVAKEVGVTQPYVFHFFKNKEELFKAVNDRAMNRIYETFTQVEAPPDRLMETMGHAFIQIMEVHRDEILMVMQAHAISEPEIRDYMKKQFQIIYETIVVKFKSAGILNPEEAASQFIGTGLLITVSEVLDLPQLLCFKSK